MSEENMPLSERLREAFKRIEYEVGESSPQEPVAARVEDLRIRMQSALNRSDRPKTSDLNNERN